jgi:predicted Zn-dependent peptidase
MSSRLWQRIREDSGLAYSVYSGVNSFVDCGFLMVYAATNPAAGDRVVREVVRELGRLKEEPVADEEFRVAKEHLKGALMLSLESSASRMSNLARQEIYFGRQFTNEQVLRSIDAVTARQLQALARDLFLAEKCALAVVGPLSRFKTRQSHLDF